MKTGQKGYDGPRRKLLAFRAVAAGLLLLATAALLEIGAVLIYPAVFHKPFSRAAIQSQLLAKEEPGFATNQISASEPSFIRNHILHPYLGFVANPGAYSAGTEFSREGQSGSVNEFGFPGASPIVKQGKDTVNVCVLGGSFAMNFFLDSKDTLAAELKKRPGFAGKDVRIVAMAMTGWKQPQQLLGLTYCVSQGAQYDVVVNLDGFNELVLPFAENHPGGVYPFYPRLWSLYTSRFLLPDDILLQFSELVRLKEKARARREFFSSGLLRRSDFCLVLFAVLDRDTQNRLSEGSAELQNMMAHRLNTRSYENSGPKELGPDAPEAFLAAMADYWAGCSRQMAAMCKNSGAAYVHLLQPNQYVAGSKTLTAEERATAYAEGTNYIYKTAVEMGYGGLSARGQKLKDDGIQFVDLTMLFRGVQESLYKDQCCHVNKRGNDIIAAVIAQKIGEAMAK